MTGEIAPLPELVDLAEYNARILVDEAHAVGTIGPGGRGTVAHFDLNDRVDLISGTFSKTFGSMGGFLAGPQSVKDFLMHHSRQLMYTASLLRLLRQRCWLRCESFEPNQSWLKRCGPMRAGCEQSWKEWAQLPSFRLGGRSGGHWTRRANVGVQPTYFRRRHFCQSFYPLRFPPMLVWSERPTWRLRSKRLARSAGYLFRVGTELGVIGPNKEAMAEHWAKLAQQMAI